MLRQIVLLLKEYLSSGDAVEAMRCVKELEVPHFHHELVYEATVMVLEDMGERTADLVCKLLKSLYVAVIITPEQMKWVSYFALCRASQKSTFCYFVEGLTCYVHTLRQEIRFRRWYQGCYPAYETISSLKIRKMYT